MQGLGVGLIWVPMNVMAFSTLRSDYVPDGTAILHLIRNMGSSVFISICIIVALRSAKITYANLAEVVSSYNKLFDVPFLTGAWSIESSTAIGVFSNEMSRQSLMNGYLTAFFVFSLLAVIAIPLVLLIRMPKSEE